MEQVSCTVRQREKEKTLTGGVLEMSSENVLSRAMINSDWHLTMTGPRRTIIMT